MIINGFEFFEDSGSRKSPVYRYSPENAQIQRGLYIVDGTPARVSEAARALLGYQVVEEDDGAAGVRRWISRELPAPYPAEVSPDNPAGDPYIYAQSIPVFEPCGRPTDVDVGSRTAYNWYRAQTVWEALSYNCYEDSEQLATQGPLADQNPAQPARPDEGEYLRQGWSDVRFITKDVDHGAKTISMRQGLAKFEAAEGQAAQPIPEGIGISQSRILVNYTWHCVPLDGIPENQIRLSLNCVNDNEFDGYQTGTLLLSSAKIRLYRSALGQRLADVGYRMIYLPNYDKVNLAYRGWNSLFRVVANRFRYWYFSADGTLPFVGGDNVIFRHVSFPALFRPTQG